MSTLRQITPLCLAVLLILTSGMARAACVWPSAHIGGPCEGHTDLAHSGTHDHGAPVGEDVPADPAQTAPAPEPGPAACASLSCMAVAVLPEAPRAPAERAHAVVTGQVADMSTLLAPKTPDRPPIL